MIGRSGGTYTVDEASSLLGVPRPTLYRYLKEYSIPYQRRSGRISVPEESLARIRTVRELHDEGLGTEAVRRRLRGGAGSADVDWIAERLDRLSEALDASQSNLKHTGRVSSSQALHIILARQSLLISAVFNLTEMMEELLGAAGRSRKPSLDYLDEQSRLDPATGPQHSAADVRGGHSPQHTISGAHTPVDSEPVRAVSGPARHDGFGTLARRRRRALTVCAILILILALVAAAFAWRALAS